MITLAILVIACFGLGLMGLLFSVATEEETIFLGSVFCVAVSACLGLALAIRTLAG